MWRNGARSDNLRQVFHQPRRGLAGEPAQEDGALGDRFARRKLLCKQTARFRAGSFHPSSYGRRKHRRVAGFAGRW